MTNLKPHVSIGMPVYNGESFIEEALDSLLSQTFTELELIISDNASTDGTEAVCREYAAKDNRIRYVRQAKNLGAAANFKYVLDEAVGEYFMWAAHDDMWAPDFVADAVFTLSDKKIKFVFPVFELRSKIFRFSKKFDRKNFGFVEAEDRRQRVLGFVNLHYLSHSANIVYSIFRTDFLRFVQKEQDISNDGAMGAVLLGHGRAALSNSLFSKRYRTFYPGMLPIWLSILLGWLQNLKLRQITKQAISSGKSVLIDRFPEYKNEIEYIYGRYQPNSYCDGYQICTIDDIL